MNQPSAELPPPAPILQRAVAWVIDAIILAIFGLIARSILNDFRAADITIAATLLAILSTYHIAFLIGTSTTPGKIALGLWVCNKQGERLQPDQAILRQLVLTAMGSLGIIGFEASLALNLLLIVSILMVLLDRGHRRALHDRIAGTLVVRGRPPHLEETY